MDLSKIKDLKDLQTLLDVMGRYGLVELEIEGDGKKIRLRKSEPAAPREVIGIPGYSMAPIAAPSVAVPAAGAPAGSATAAPEPPRTNHKDITSPMVGTFYRAPSPEADPFVREGDPVTPDTTLCIIEAMKVMNEIPAGTSGIIREVLVKNGESVEFGQPLFRVESD